LGRRQLRGAAGRMENLRGGRTTMGTRTGEAGGTQHIAIQPEAGRQTANGHPRETRVRSGEA
jgi:hypothetical protein